MEQTLIESNAQIGLHVDGGNQIDAELLARTIADFASLTKEAAVATNPDAYVKVNVTAFKNGSFEILFSTVCSLAENLYNNPAETATLATTVIGGVVGIFQIKKHLKGEKPKSAEEKNDTLEIENNKGEVLSVPKNSGIILNNVKVDQLTINISNNIREHNPDGGFSLNTDSIHTDFDKQDLSHMVKAIPIEQVITCQRYQVTTTLAIKKPDLLGRSAWEFYYKENRISANILDEDWLDRLHNREFAIGAGDTINSDLEIYVDLDINGNPEHGSERYTVTIIHGTVNHPPEQMEL